MFFNHIFGVFAKMRNISANIMRQSKSLECQHECIRHGYCGVLTDALLIMW